LQPGSIVVASQHLMQDPPTAPRATTSQMTAAPTPDLASQPDPAQDYADAMVRFERLSARDGPEINPVCRTQLLTRGGRTANAIVLVHGIPNCPQQYAQLGPLLYDRGFNVLIPRMPYLGYLDRATRELRNLTAEDLRLFADETTDIARGLGARVVYLGLSAGGVVATWVAQFRGDVDQAVLIAPALHVPHVPGRLNGALIALMTAMPDRYMKRSAAAMAVTPPYVYYGQSSRAIGQMMRLGANATRAARSEPPAAKSILVVTSAYDTVVDNGATRRLLARWRAQGARRIETYEFAADLKIVHDMIDPVRGDQQVDVVYPVLLDLIMAGAQQAES
jgi:alpha-beta hydrolase superfamily lysophospholipase